MYTDLGHLYSPTAGKVVVPNTRELLESVIGKPLDSSFYDEKSPDYASNMALQRQVQDLVSTGGGLDTRDWAAIMQSDNPLQAAQSATKEMYADPTWQQKNLQLQTQELGKDPAGVYAGYAMNADKYGFDYTPSPEALAGITFILSDSSWRTRPGGTLGNYWDMARKPVGQRPFDRFDLSKLAPSGYAQQFAATNPSKVSPPRKRYNPYTGTYEQLAAPVTMPYGYKAGGRVRLI